MEQILHHPDYLDQVFQQFQFLVRVPYLHQNQREMVLHLLENHHRRLQQYLLVQKQKNFHQVLVLEPLQIFLLHQHQQLRCKNLVKLILEMRIVLMVQECLDDLIINHLHLHPHQYDFRQHLHQQPQGTQQ